PHAAEAPVPRATRTLSLHDALPISGDRANPAFDSRPGDRPGRENQKGRPRGASLDDPVQFAFGGEDRARLRESRSAASGPDFRRDRKSTRLNSSHEWISYAVFCLKK